MTSNLPSWSSADHCYSKAYRLLEKWSAANYRAAKAVYKGKRTMPCPAPTPEMLSLIAALNCGDEEQIKGIILAGDNYRATDPPIPNTIDREEASRAHRGKRGT